MATQMLSTPAPPTYMQGVAVPAESVNPLEFYARTRRHINLEQQFSYTGQPQQIVELRKSDILSTVRVVFDGQVTITPGTGTVASTAAWPYDFLQRADFTANQSANLISASGLKLKIREFMKKSDLSDRGVAQTFGGVARTQGTLASSSESWGVGANTSALTAGTFPVHLEWILPVAEDEVDLAGAVFLATSSSSLTLALQLNSIANMFALTGNGAAAITGNFQVITTKFSIPIGANGQIVVPDLSMFHSLIQTRVANGVQNGENELRIIGQGAGKSLLRMFYQVFNGVPPAPLSMNSTNFGRQMWRYSNSETPDAFIDGNHMRDDEERRYNVDIGALWGVGCHDFANENSFRDVVDMGTTSELRLVTTIQSGVVLSSPAVEIVTETMFAAGQAA
jgi:hypothetical protein